jgi:hypothetical protein
MRAPETRSETLEKKNKRPGLEQRDVGNYTRGVPKPHADECLAMPHRVQGKCQPLMRYLTNTNDIERLATSLEETTLEFFRKTDYSISILDQGIQCYLNACGEFA